MKMQVTAFTNIVAAYSHSQLQLANTLSWIYWAPQRNKEACTISIFYQIAKAEHLLQIIRQSIEMKPRL
jgi:hypothetical protein